MKNILINLFKTDWFLCDNGLRLERVNYLLAHYIPRLLFSKVFNEKPIYKNL